MRKYKYNINNLDCANCAIEVEKELNKHFTNAKVNFNTSIITFESEKEYKLKEINKIVKNVEPEASVTEEKINVKKEYHLWILIFAILICLIGYYLINDKYKIIFYIISYTLLLYKTFIKAIKILVKNKRVDENALITISCIGALCLGEVMEGMMVVVLYTIGKILEEKAINNSRRSISNLIDLKEPYANKKEGIKEIKVSVEDLKIGDIVIIKKGEKIPVDGIVIEGKSKIDTSNITGESLYKNIDINDQILSGCINMDNVIKMKVTKTYSDSTVAQILSILEEATDKKSKLETNVSKFSQIYTPTIILSAVLLIVILPLFNISLNESIYRSLTFLVISCPCAIAISVPLSYFTGIGIASKNGILIKGSNYLDNLVHSNNIIFDKTGTLTTGEFGVSDIKIIDKNYTKQQIINILVNGEKYSNHPIARSFMNLKKTEDLKINNFREIEGKGIEFNIDNKKITVGNKKICSCEYDAILHLNIDGKHVASITINDGLKANAKKVIEDLQNKNINVHLLTGDKKDVAFAIGKKLGIDDIRYEMLPTDKYKIYEEIDNNSLSIFVGDGVNDAPVLKRADIGISMGNVGSEVAIEASDIVIMNDDLSKIPLAIDISKYTKKIIKQNLLFAFSTKIIILLLSIFGLATMYLAVFADTGVTLITIINTLRIKNKFAK